MSWLEDTKSRLQFVALPMALMCPVFLILQAGDAMRQIASYRWPSVTGEVLHVIARSWWDEDSETTKYYGRVVYRYSVDGNEYTSELTELGPGTKRLNQQAALDDVGQYRPGKEVAVYYDPANPSEGILIKGIPTVHAVLLVALCLGTVVCVPVSYFTIRGWIRAWQMRPSQAVRTPTPLTASDLPDFGECLKEYRPGIETVAAGFIMSVLLIGAGLAVEAWVAWTIIEAGGQLPIQTRIGMSWLAVGIISLLAIGVIIGGVLLWRHANRLRARRVRVCANGIFFMAAAEVEAIHWDQVESIQETVTQWYAPLKGLAKRAIPLGKTSSYVIRRHDGSDRAIDGDVVNLEEFVQILEDQAEKCQWAWNVIERDMYQ